MGYRKSLATCHRLDRQGFAQARLVPLLLRPFKRIRAQYQASQQEAISTQCQICQAWLLQEFVDYRSTERRKSLRGALQFNDHTFVRKAQENRVFVERGIICSHKRLLKSSSVTEFITSKRASVRFRLLYFSKLLFISHFKSKK